MVETTCANCGKLFEVEHDPECPICCWDCEWELFEQMIEARDK